MLVGDSHAVAFFPKDFVPGHLLGIPEQMVPGGHQVREDRVMRGKGDGHT